MTEERHEQPTHDERAEFERLARETANDTYRAIGQCITAWSRMEGFLVGIAGMLLNTEREKVGLILYSINSFPSWMTIIEELFAIDPRYAPLRPDWIKISKRLLKLNTTRVSLAHHALVPGKGIEHLMEVDDDFSALFPTLRPNRFDTRSRSRKHTPVGMDELMTFVTELGEVGDKISELFDQMTPIFLERRKRPSDRIKGVKGRLQEMVAHRDAIRADYGG